MALLPVLAVAFPNSGGAPDGDTKVITTRADVLNDKAADCGERELQVAGGSGEGQAGRVEAHGKALPEKIVLPGNPEGREVHVHMPGAGAALVAQRQAQRRGRSRSRGGSGDLERFQIDSADIGEARLGFGKGVDAEAKHLYSHAKAAYGRDGESPKRPLQLQQIVREETSQDHHPVDSASLDQISQPLTTSVASGVTQPANGDIAIQMRTVLNQPAEETEESDSSREEAIKSAMKFSYVAISITGAALVTIYFEYYVNQSVHGHDLLLRICTLNILSSFLSGVSIPLLNFLQHHISVSLHIFRTLKYTTFALLILALLDVSFLFMKTIALFAFLPVIAAIVIGCVVAFYEGPSTSYDHHQH